MLPDSSMASLRSGRRGCIRAAFSATSTRAGFQKRNTRHRLKFLDPYASLEDTPARSACRFRDCSPGTVTCHWPSHTPTSRSPAHAGDTPSGEAPALASLGDNDVDMQPEKMTEEDWGPLPPAVEPPETGRQAQGRARASRPPPRLGGERDKGPKLSLSKRKLELLLSEPEKRKRKKQYVT
ncbi:uncharacterized protein WM277_004847 isoform 1-T1 [Molossus nigricans]